MLEAEQLQRNIYVLKKQVNDIFSYQLGISGLPGAQINPTQTFNVYFGRVLFTF